MIVANTAVAIAAALTGLCRLVEIGLGEINAAALRKKGAKEYEPMQRIPIFGVYTLWLILLCIFTLKTITPNYLWLTCFLAMEALRWWAIVHLKQFWTTRIMILPGATRVTSGPYRFIPHPIYVALGLEVVFLSLAFRQPSIAAFCGGLTALWIFFRIRSENAALAQLR